MRSDGPTDTVALDAAARSADSRAWISDRITRPTEAVLMVAGATAWTIAVSLAAIWRHNQFLSHRFDLGNMVQAVWSTTQGRPLEMTDAATGEQITRLAAHVDPILVLFAPLWLVFPRPELLLVGQAAALASGVYPVVRLARKHVRDPVAVSLLAVWYLAFPWVVWLGFNDFHPVALAVPLLLYAIWFLDEDRLVAFAFCAGLALMTGELVGLTVAGIGVWYALAHHRARRGLAIVAVGAGWSICCLLIVVPFFNGGEPSRYYSRFESVGGSPAGLAATLLSDPGAVLDEVSRPEDFDYVLALLLPTAFYVLAAPLMLFALAPQLAVNLLSDWWSTTQPVFHYSSALLPALIAASIMGIGRLPLRYRSIASAWLLLLGVASLLATPPRPGAQDFVFDRLEPPARRASMRAAIGLVPPGVAVAATNRLGAHLSDRRIVQLFPTREGVRWVILDLRNPWLQVAGEQSDPRRFAAEIARFERERGWLLVYDEQDVRVYERQEWSGTLHESDALAVVRHATRLSTAQAPHGFGRSSSANGTIGPHANALQASS